MPNQRIAVIGGVAAGPAAAAEARRTDPEAEIVLFEQGPHISYGACEIPYYIDNRVEDAETLIVFTPEKFEAARGTVVRTRHRVLGIDPKRARLDVKDLRTETVTEERFDKIILATGARSRLPDFEGLEAPNAFPVRRLDEAKALKTYLEHEEVRHAVILGGGHIGVEMAESLHERGIRVTIVEPGEGLLNRYINRGFQEMVHKEMDRHGVAIHQELPTGVECDRRGRITAVRTDRGEKIGCQLVLIAIGLELNTELGEAAGARLGPSGAFDVDAQMRTSVPNLWACGDCAEVERVIDGKKIHLPLSPVAFRSARVAARNAARKGRGAPARFPGVTPASAVVFFDLEVAAVGLHLDEAREAGFDAFSVAFEGTSRVSFYPGARPLHVYYVVERQTGRILGAQLLGEEGAALRANVLVPLVREGATVSAIKDLDLIYTPPVAPSLDPLLRAAARAERKL